MVFKGSRGGHNQRESRGHDHPSGTREVNVVRVSLLVGLRKVVFISFCPLECDGCLCFTMSFWSHKSREEFPST